MLVGYKPVASITPLQWGGTTKRGCVDVGVALRGGHPSYAEGCTDKIACLAQDHHMLVLRN